VLAAATAAAAMAWVLLPLSPAEPQGGSAAPGAAASWEYDLIYESTDPAGSGESGGGEMLPDDYRAIASVFLDG
jgi:hypothetical protein